VAYGERNSWAALVASAISIAVYLAIVAPQIGSRPVGEIEWSWPMLWTILGGLALSIAASIAWGLLVHRSDPQAEHVEDVRDVDISRLGERVGQAFLTIGLVAVLLMCAARMDWFWIANAAYLGFALSAVADCLTRVIVYRAGMP